MVTLLHKSPDNAPDVIRELVRTHGKRDAKGRLSFRHTVRPRTGAAGQLFSVDYRDNQIVVRLKPSRAGRASAGAAEPRWSDQALIGAVGAKLRRLILVKGEKRTSKGARTAHEVRYVQADAYEEFSLMDFVAEILRGVIVIDFDAREISPGSHPVRDHGTKFRIPPGEICRLYMDKRRIR